MDIKIIYEDSDVLVVDKPAGLVVFEEIASSQAPRNDGKITLIDELLEKYPKLTEVGPPPRYGIVHRLDKDTSGILLVAKTSESLIFLQKQFINREVEKKYVCLVEGDVKEEKGEIKTLIARSKGDFRKQVVINEGQRGLPAGRQAITEYKVIKRYTGDKGDIGFTLLEVQIKTGRKHQIRCHLSYLKHPIAGDKLYSFKNSKIPGGLTRQFLHAKYLKIKLLNGEVKEFYSELPEDLKHVKINGSVQ